MRSCADFIGQDKTDAGESNGTSRLFGSCFGIFFISMNRFKILRERGQAYRYWDLETHFGKG